jgi:hypothetical protein
VHGQRAFLPPLERHRPSPAVGDLSPCSQRGHAFAVRIGVVGAEFLRGKRIAKTTHLGFVAGVRVASSAAATHWRRRRDAT